MLASSALSMAEGPLDLSWAMGCVEPRVRCEILFFQPLLASTALSALDAVDADSGIGAVVRQLMCSEIFCAKPSLTLGALPRCAIGYVHFDTLLAIFAKRASTWFAPLVRWKLLLKLGIIATSATCFRHILFRDSLPINILPTQKLHKQFRTFYFTLGEHLPLERSINQ